MLWGIQISSSGDHKLSLAHAHLNLVGRVTLAMFGAYYHLVPAAAETMLAQIHLAVAVLGVIAIVPGIVLAITDQGEMLAVVGSILTMISMVIFW